MARLSATARKLARLIDLARQPVYLLDAESRLIYCNQACAEWVGVPGEMLLGQKCLYHSQAEPGSVEAAATGLAPPPEAWSNWVTTAGVTGGRFAQPLRRRLACFVPLNDEDGEPLGLLVLVQEEDLPEKDQDIPIPAASTPWPDEAAHLHETIRQFHLEKAGRYRMDGLIGEVLWMQRVRAQVDAAAASRANVLIVGPTGSGREHTAQAIYYATEPTGRGPLIPLDCAIMPEELIQATLMNLHHRYPPSSATRPTLLLLEVDQLPAEAHRILEESARRSAFRVLSTARMSLLDLAEQEAFPPQLAVWLSTLVIELPPLAQRRQDIPLLAQAFVEQLNAQGGKQIRGFSPEALDRLDAYDWPGNLDELAQVVAEAYKKADGPLITVADLPKTIHLAWDAAAYPRRPEQKIVLDEFLKKIEGELVRRALRQAKGNKAKAARLLGLSRPRLYRLLVEHGLLERS
ncbi:MAG: sigma 54-interacting transcriptional regulator [Thermoguttaceae bacterium]|nr:sigma 54-interacting transcriptional regulator [Thermoguttaceae bacterium]MDW8038746.1 sigma 54-interacting transcriptional regulator [Thermoguttaceae bacterium]